jgi:peptidoglycan/LPS O-acetylase OafA/YrhL
MTLAVTNIAAGNSLFGILTRPLSRAFGDISYSIYLLHGIVLYVAIRFVVGTERTAAFSPAQYWALISTCGAFLVGISVLSFRYVEMPAMQRVSSWTAALRARFGTSQRAARREPDVIVAAPERIDRSAP